ncbi:MAG: WYL domain-containing protein [Armatimonadetes bacterium]|nr:WYL domain-containing protein [Armatimonadota bacterium]
MTLEEQFARLIKTLQLIEKEPWKWNVEALEVEFGVGRATVERDIRILRQWGTIQRKNGYFALKEMKFLPTSFTPSEALALVLAGNFASEQIGMPQADAIQTALRKVNATLLDQVESSIKKMRKRISVGVNLIRECNSEVLNTISRAISSHNPIEIKYYAAHSGETTKRKVDPYGLTFRFGAWYLIGFCHLRGDIRTFGVDRIRSIHVLKDHFRYPTNFDLEEYLSHGWQLQADAEPEKIILRFSPKITRWISGCRFHPHQKITKEPDGSILFEVTVAGVDEIKHWVLSFGDNVEVLAPQSLRASIAQTARAMAEKYSGARLIKQLSSEEKSRKRFERERLTAR